MKSSSAFKVWVFCLISLCLVAPAGGDSQSNASTASNPQQDEESSRAYVRGKELILKGEYEKAIPFFEQALRADRQSPVLNSQLAEAHLRLRNVEKAEDYAKKAVDAEPNNTDYRNTLAGIYAGLKKYDEAKEQYLKVEELDPQNGKASLLIGILEAERGILS